MKEETRVRKERDFIEFCFHGNDLIAVMVLGGPTRKSKHRWELRRFSTDGRSHPGVASKLLKAFAKRYEPDTIVSFADLRWSDGNLYPRLGFVEDGRLAPDYAYVKGNRRYHKSGFRRSAIARKFGLDMTHRTERQAMDDLGYHRIWDCGKIRYIWAA